MAKGPVSQFIKTHFKEYLCNIERMNDKRLPGQSLLILVCMFWVT